jgi:hypothetical protein
MLLSILIPTVPRRLRSCYPDLLEKLLKQAEGHPVEILGLFDNKKRPVGKKRNDLMKLAQGQFLTFIDDDDDVSDDYVSLVVDALSRFPEADCLVFDSMCSVNAETPYKCRYGIEYDYTHTAEWWTGKPAHTMVWKTSIARQGVFPEKNYSEDMEWVQQVWPLVKVQDRIHKVLYYYNFRSNISETRG